MKQKRKWFSISDWFLVPLCLVFMFPFIYLVTSTFKTQKAMAFNPIGLPDSLYLDNYAKVFQNENLLQAFGNTLLITVCSVALIVLIGEMAAYPIVYCPNKLHKGLQLYLMIGFLVPFQAILLTLFDVMQTFHLVDKIGGMILFYTNGAALTVFLAVGYMRTIPKDLGEAAIIDGCTVPGVFFRIIFPLMGPITTTSVIFNAMWIWNDFVAPNIFLNTRSKGTLVLEIFRAKGQFSVDWPMFMTLSVVAILPIVIFYCIMQRHIIKGLTAGAVKA